MADGQFEVPNRWIPSPGLRAWLYGVLIAVGGALVVTGVIDGNLWEQIDRIIAAVFLIGGGSTALVNTPRPSRDV